MTGVLWGTAAAIVWIAAGLLVARWMGRLP